MIISFNTNNKSDDVCLYKYAGNSTFKSEDIETLNNDSKPEPDKQWTAKLDSSNNLLKHSDIVSVFDVSSYILNKTGSITTMKLQKLVYYCQAWSLVWDEKPLFKEQIEAWANGPVVKELFAFHRGMFDISSVAIGNQDLLNKNQKETIDAVIDYYGNKSSQWLIDLTHSEKPWRKARSGLSMTDRSNRVISLDDIAEYYSSLPPEE